MNEFTLNLQKTVYITFGSYIDSLPDNREIIVNNVQINRVSSSKYLWVYVDCHLRWDVQVDKATKRLNYLIYVFYKLKKCMNVNNLRMLYYALFHSILIYGIIA